MPTKTLAKRKLVANDAIIGIHVPAPLSPSGELESGILVKFPRKATAKVLITPKRGKPFEKSIEVEVARVLEILPGYGYLLSGPKAGEKKGAKNLCFTLTNRQVKDLQELVIS